jgi:hypothetical protein
MAAIMDTTTTVHSAAWSAPGRHDVRAVTACAAGLRGTTRPRAIGARVEAPRGSTVLLAGGHRPSCFDYPFTSRRAYLT